MDKNFIELINLLALASVFVLPLLNTKRMSIVSLGIVTIQSLLLFVTIFNVFTNGAIEYSYVGSLVTGNIPIRIDYLSAWFMLVIGFGMLIGAWYGVRYLRAYREQSGNLKLHAISYILLFVALIDLCIVQNSIVFLVVWEIMALSSFVLIIFENYKESTLKAGSNFLIQSHVSILFLTFAFIWARITTGSFNFDEIGAYSMQHPSIGMGMFLLLFIGFAIKAGFVPFHTWLPAAHPAAPAHISGVMSGVIIKIGIFGILRMLSIIQMDFTVVGYFILVVSVISGLYGVMLAIIQHNLKQLLAYHSIENIGIIGIGIGLGTLGLGTNNLWLITAGFVGALLHTLNHSLFKSLLFYGAGNIYQATHTVDIEHLGGLIKKMPHTSWLFLIASLAICGLPPFNGFVSEFFIYSGLFKGLINSPFGFTIGMLFSILSLVLIGGLAMLCFTKAFGIVFLGNSRSKIHLQEGIEEPIRNVSMYLIALAILFIGTMPFLFADILQKTTQVFIPGANQQSISFLSETLDNTSRIGLYSLGFILLSGVFFFIRKTITQTNGTLSDNTWGCGYVGEIPKAQYTASSFIRTYRKLAEPLLEVKKEKKDSINLYPDQLVQTTHPGDKIESMLINKPIDFLKKLLNRFVFLQNGNIQSYILYGFIFLTAIYLFPVLYEKIEILITYLN